MIRLDQPIRTSKRKKEARSPQQQIDMGQACALANPDYTIAMVHDSGRNESGKTMDRASLNAIMERIRAGLTDGVIVALTDRLGRAPIEEAMAWVRELHAVGGVLVLADAGGRPVDLDDPAVETNLVLQLQIARQYWAASAKRMQQTRQGAIKAGKFIGPTPFGYARHHGRLYEHPEQGPIVREAYRLAAHVDLEAASEYLQLAAPGRNWSTNYVRRLLGSRTYLGESRSGALVNPAAHEALAKLTVWTAAQTAPGKRRSNGDYVLSNVVVCGNCRSGMTGQLASRKGYPHLRYRRMRCSAVCQGGASISADKLEAHVLAEVKLLLANRVFRDRLTVGGLGDAEAELATAQADRSALTAKVKPSHPDFEAWLAEADAAVAEAKLRFTALSQKVKRSEALPGPDQLDKPQQYARALRAVTDHFAIVVAPGRGTVAERVDFQPLDGDHVAGALAA